MNDDMVPVLHPWVADQPPESLVINRRAAIAQMRDERGLTYLGFYQTLEMGRDAVERLYRNRNIDRYDELFALVCHPVRNC